MHLVPAPLNSGDLEVVRILRVEIGNAQLDRLSDFKLYQLWQIGDVDLSRLRVPRAGELCPDCRVAYSARGGCGCRG